MADDLIDLLTEAAVALGEMIGDPSVPVSYSPHLMAAKTRIRKASAEIERMRAAINVQADLIERRAFDIPAPNPYTPEFMMIALTLRAALHIQTSGKGE